MPSSPGHVGSTGVVFRMTIGRPRPWPSCPHHAGLISATMTGVIATCSSHPRLRHRLSSDPASRRAPLLRRMVPVITVHRGLPPPECTSLLDTPGETACATKKQARGLRNSHEESLTGYRAPSHHEGSTLFVT